MLPYNAYSKRNKLKNDANKTKNDENKDNDNGDNDNKDKDKSRSVQNGETSNKDGGSGNTAEPVKGRELVERDKWEVTAVEDAQQGACGVDKEKS